MSTNPEIVLTRAQYERAWQLTLALAQNEASMRKSLDVLFIGAARFVQRVDGAVDAGSAVELDSGKGGGGPDRVLYSLIVKD
jgi:hypothetical protein